MAVPTPARSRPVAPRFDASDPAVLADPYPTYARLRAAGPLCRGGPGTWMVTRYADVSALLVDRRLVNKPPEMGRGPSPYGDGAAAGLLSHMLSGREPPEHTRLRQLIGTAFSPRLMRAMREDLHGLVDDLLRPALDRGHFDAVSELAFPLQARMVCDLVGIPRERQNEIWPQAMHLGRTFIPYAIPTREQVTVADALAADLRTLVLDLFELRRREPADDLLSRMAAGVGDGLTRDDLVDNVVFLFFAGFETTMNVIGTAFATLLAHPDQLARLYADRSLVPTAVDELLRYDAPAQYTVRLTSEPIEIGDRTVRAGRMLLLMMGSANRDERQFPHPDVFDVGRRPNAHVSFGGGIHHCMGWALGRVEIEEVLRAVLDRCAELRPAGPTQRLAHPNFRAHTRVPVGVRAR
jgi:cytochrome P450